MVTCFNNQSKHNLILCIFVFKIIQFNRYCWFITTELRQSTLSHAWTDLISIQETYFLHMAHHSLVASGTICLGAIWNIEITNKNAKKKEKMWCQTDCKEYLFIVWELKQKCRWLKVGYCLVWSQSGACSISKFQKFFMLSAWFQMTVKAALALVWGLQINFREEANSQTEIDK